MIDLGFQGGVATLTLNRAPVNAISAQWVDRFDGQLDALAAHDGCQVVLIRSSQRIFGAGADLAEFRERFASDDGAALTFDFLVRIQALYARVAALPQITIAEIGGAAMGGSLELALCCDFRIAAEDARLGLPEARLGLIPGAGGTQRLTWLCGPAVAARLILASEVVTGAEAEACGLVQWAVPRDELGARVAALIESVSQLSGSALADAKACIAHATYASEDGFRREREATRRLFDEPETRERIHAFLAKPAPAPARIVAG